MLAEQTCVLEYRTRGSAGLKMEQYPKGIALFINRINQGGYEAGYIRHLSISNLTGDAPNHTYEHG
jgi:hypothetical protein